MDPAGPPGDVLALYHERLGQNGQRQGEMAALAGGRPGTRAGAGAGAGAGRGPRRGRPSLLAAGSPGADSPGS